MGKVYLIGAGPGDPGLITVKGLRCLQEAEVVVYDRLVDSRLLTHARRDAELVFVGKGPGQRAMEQVDIDRFLVDRAKEGKVVARLKGGDPFVFGRGGEEALALADGGVPFEVVPGITSAIAAPAYAGIPLTHRGLASSLTVVSGSEDPGKAESAVRWDALARDGGTLVVLMGWAALESITATLQKEGMPGSTAVALIQWGTEPYQQTITGTLKNILDRGRQAGLSSPVVAVIGPVVELRDQIRWFDSRPLFGKRVLVTRSRTQASVLSRMLEDEGAQPVELPTIEFAPPAEYSQMDGAISALGDYSWVIFTSANGVDALFSRVEQLGLDSRVFGDVKVGVIGPATAAALSRRGIKADLVPAEYVSESVVEAMAAQELKGCRVLLPRADIGREELAEGLTRLGARVDQVVAYRTIIPEESRARARDLLKDCGVDLVTFTSSSTVRNTLDLLDGDSSILSDATIACIGPITATAARSSGLHVDVVAREYTVPGLVAAVREHFSRDGIKEGG